MAEVPNNIGDMTDETLVRLSLSYEQAFVQLIDRYERKLFFYIRKISNFEKEEVEEILQDVFLSVYRNLHAFDDTLSFSSWVYRITRNKTISQYRKHERRPRGISIDASDTLAAKLRSSEDLEATFDQGIERDALLQAIEQLPIKYKEVLILKFLEEKDYTEISDILKIPIGTVGTRINRAKKQLRKTLSP